MLRRLLRVLPFSVAVVCLTAVASLSPTTGGTVAAQDHPPCVTDVSVESLGSAMPADAEGFALLALRLTIGPGGGFDAHTHPGTLIVTVESGEFTFTQLDHSGMIINRAAVDGTPTAPEELIPNEEVTLHPGDWLAEAGDMVHTGFNRTDAPTVVLVNGLVDPELPFVQCVDAESANTHS
jgi:quercetin dioxygenase-like cupin family protein